MRNIAISLLLADAANAQRASKGPDNMDADRKMPNPKLIADAYTDGLCVDTTVTAKKTVVTTKTSAWQALIDEKKKTQDAAVTTAIAEKKTAVDAVIAKDAAMAADVKKDDDAQAKEMTLKEALDKAAYAKAAATTAQTAAVTAQAAADTAKTAAVAVQTAMNTAATAAATHYGKEQAQTTQLKSDRGTAEGAYNTVTATIAGLTLLNTNAKSAYDTKATEVATKLATKTEAAFLKTKTNAVLVTAAAAINPATDPSVAKTLATEKATLATKLGELNTKLALWNTKAQLTVKAMKNWVAAEAYTSTSGTNGCKSASGGDLVDHDAGDANTGLCKTKCSDQKAWGMNAGNTFPIATGTTGAGYCYAYSYKAANTECKHVQNPTVNAGDTAVATTCSKRTKSTYGAGLFNANELSKTGVALHNDYVTKLTAWDTQNGVETTAQGKVDVATAYHGKVDTDNTSKNSASSTADSAWTTANGQLTPLTTAYTTATKNMNDAIADKAAKLAAWNSLKAQVITQEKEETDQLAIKGLADTDKTKQDALVGTLNTAFTTAAGAKVTADTAVTTKTTAHTTAQTAYNAQVTIAAGTATALTTPLGALTTLRATAATKTTALATALTNQKSQQTLIDNAAKALATAQAEELAAVVACKEAEFDKYKKTLATAEATRAAALTAIEALIAKNKAATPAAGKAGARCEKALSNGTMRPKRGEGTCDTGLCCGAAKVPIGKAMMTIETCQAKGAKTYGYIAPRAPMQTTPNTATDYPFTCIEGAKKVAATASALAAALYMMA